jgi:hypothetical protein
MPLLPRPGDVISVHTASTELEAGVIRDLLQEAGIQVMLRSRVVPGYQIQVPPGVWGDVLVRPADEAEARRVIAEYLDALAAEGDEPPTP